MGNFINVIFSFNIDLNISIFGKIKFEYEVFI